MKPWWLLLLAGCAGTELEVGLGYQPRHSLSGTSSGDLFFPSFPLSSSTRLEEDQIWNGWAAITFPIGPTPEVIIRNIEGIGQARGDVDLSPSDPTSASSDASLSNPNSAQSLDREGSFLSSWITWVVGSVVAALGTLGEAWRRKKKSDALVTTE